MGGGFAALMDENDDLGDDDMEDEPSESKVKKEPKKKKEIVDSLQTSIEDDKGKKGKKKKGKKKGEDEEDLDKILAELESEYMGEKPKEGAKNEDVPTENIPVPEPAEEETGKKKKKKKKDQAEELSTAEVSPMKGEELPEVRSQRNVLWEREQWLF